MITFIVIALILIVAAYLYGYIEKQPSTFNTRLTQNALVATSAIIICIVIDGGMTPIPPEPPVTGNDFGGYRPHYQGHGTKTVGGRGGEVRRAHDGPSLTEAVKGRAGCVNTPASCGRIVIFDASGNYDGMGGQLTVNSPFLTIAGQTAPDDGVTLINTRFVIDTNDVVVQHLRVRKPPTQLNACSIGEAGDGGDNSHVFNIVFDHVTCTWSVGSNTLLVAGPGSHDISLLDSLIGEGTWYSGDGGINAGIGHHNTIARSIFTQAWARQPIFGNSGAQSGVITQRALINNINYNGTDQNIGGGALAGFFGDLDGDGLNPYQEENVLINNYSKVGQDSGGSPAFLAFSKRTADHVLTYLSGNQGQGVTSLENDGQWTGTICGAYGSYQNVATCGPGSNMRTNELFQWFKDFQFVIIPPEEMFDSVLSTAGARPKNRDDADERMINDIRNGTGSHFFHPDSISIPNLNTQTRACSIPTNIVTTTNGRNTLDEYLESDSVCGAKRLE